MWNEMASELNSSGIVEYGIYQRDRKPNAPFWRRHAGSANFRFSSVYNALFAEKGARSACFGTASYPKSEYAKSDELIVPYVSTWLNGLSYAYFLRASAGDPEITIVSVSAIENVKVADEASFSIELAQLFAQGASEFGIRFLGERCIRR